MSESTTQQSPAFSLDDLRALLRDPQVAALYGQMAKEDRDKAKALREREAAEQAARFNQLRESIENLVEDIHVTHEPRNFTAKKGKRVGQVTGRGYHTTGVMTLPDDTGALRETRVTVFVKWDPKSVSTAPADSVDGDDDDD